MRAAGSPVHLMVQPDQQDYGQRQKRDPALCVTHQQSPR